MPGNTVVPQKPLRFDGQTAIVTGAGGNPGLGRAHAMLLAARGANVVVNDIGPDPYSVVDEIIAAGGRAVADTHSVSTEDGALDVVKTAMRAFGGVDILVNNAAISVAAAFDEISTEDFRRHIDVNLMGSFFMCRAAWPLMKARGYGRIINITTAAMTGIACHTAYGASKGGIWSFTRALAAEGRAHGILANAVSPGAFTQLVAGMMEADSPLLQYSRDHLPAELSSPVVAYLAHQDCTVSGECIDSAGGMVQRTYIARTRGFTDPALSIESVAAHFADVMQEADAETIGIGSFDTAEWKLKPYKAGALK